MFRLNRRAGRRRPRPVALVATTRRAPASATRAVGLHSARPPPAQDGCKARVYGSRLLARFDRVVVHSEHGKERLGELGVDARVIPLPISASNVERRDDGRTLLFAGVIRPYKGLPDAFEVVRRIEDSRLLVAGDPSEPVDARGDRVEWRLGYLPQVRARPRARRGHRRALPLSTGARPERGAHAGTRGRRAGGLLRRRWDRRTRAAFAAGRVVPAGDLDALTEAARELLDDPEALAAAREGARRARETLTWDASARSHLELYRELT